MCVSAVLSLFVGAPTDMRIGIVRRSLGALPLVVPTRILLPMTIPLRITVLLILPPTTVVVTMAVEVAVEVVAVEVVEVVRKVY